MTATRAKVSKFRRLSVTHAAMTGGDAAMLVALADSLFLSIDPSAARSRVLLFLVVSFAPFVVLAPMIGPVIDRAAGGRRTVIQLVAVGRVVLALLMAIWIDNLALFPLVFAALVLQKSYIVSKSALVPSVVRTEIDLVEANAKLGVIAGLTGFVAVIPAALLQVIPATSGSVTLVYSAALFAVALGSATRLPPDVVAATAEQPLGRAQLHGARLRMASITMLLLRGCVGFTFFHLAFWLRTQSAGTAWFGLAVGMSALATMVGNIVAPRLRASMTEERMLAGALVLSAAGGIGTAMFGGIPSGVVLAVAVNLAASVGRLAFESIVQRDAPSANRGRAFAQFETRFQLAWVLAGLIPVVVVIPGQIGFLLVGLVGAGAVANLVAGVSVPRPPRLPARRR
ncbi:MAG: hypothetical protein H0W46_01820 [Acidimicrobiia bacterium]|nr:hypothetical protein [Acidimicrobiia bacterium]